MFILWSILLGVFIFIGGVSAININKEEYRETFSVEPGTVLKVINKSGDIDVNGWERDYIEVIAIKKISWWNCFLKEPDIDVATDKEFVVRTVYSSPLSWGIPVLYRITAPKGVLVTHLETSTGKINLKEVSGNVDVKTSTGEIQIQGLNGFVKAVTSTGNFNVDQVAGDVVIKASTGEIQIHKVDGLVKAVTSTGKINVDEVAGDVDAKTSAGAIHIHKVKGFVKAVTSNGEIDITGVGGLAGASTSNGNISVEVPAIRDSLEIRTTTGSIIAFFSPEVAGELEVSTANGQITYSDLPLTVSKSARTKLLGRLGAGGESINIKTSTGSVTLKKLQL